MPQDKQVTFGPYRLDEANECLWRGSEAIALRPKAFGVLRCLVERPGQLVTKEHLLDAVWPGTYVGDAVLKDSVRQLREALGDDPKAPRYIETAHRRGYRFVGQLADAAPAPPAAPAPEPAAPEPARTARLLGRDTALARMRHWLGGALRAERQVVFVTGEPGIGKTTLVEAFLEEAGAAGSISIAQGQCLEHYGAGEAYLPVLDGLSRLGRGPDGARVVELLRKHAPTWLAQLPSLVSAEEREAWQARMQGATRERMLREMAEAVEALAAERPLVLVLEDLHWSDYSTLDLISYVARRRDPARLMVIGTYRPVEVILGEHPLKGVKRELQAHRLCDELPLEYLTEEDVAAYLAVRFPGHQLPPRLTRLIHQRTEGNPLFLVNVVEYLVDGRTVVERDGLWRLQAGWDDVELGVPDNLRHLIERQIERLSPEEQRVLEGASVVGTSCSAVAIGAGLAEDPVWVEEHCEELVRRHQFLSPAKIVELPDGTITPRYEFIHSLYVDVPYSRIPAMRRAQIEQRVGVSGEAIYGDRVGEIASELAMHFEEGRDWPRAVKYLRMAAENAIARSAHFEAGDLARRGLDVLGTLPETPERDQQELAVRMLLGASLMATRGFASAEVEEVFERAKELCDRQEPSPLQYGVLWSLGLFHVFRSDLEQARVIGEQLLDLAKRLGDPALVMEAHRAVGVTLIDRGEFVEGLEHLDEACAMYEPNRRHPYMLLTAYDCKTVSDCFAARALWALGYPDRALARAREAVAHAREIGHTPSHAVAANFVALVHQLRGEAPEAQERAESGIALTREQGLDLWTAFGLVFRGWARVWQGTEAGEGIDELRLGLATYEASGAKLWRTRFLGMLAESLGVTDRVDEGIEVVDQALAAVDATGERHYEAELYRTKGKLLLRRGDSSGAADHFRRAIAVARAQGARSCELRSATSLACLDPASRADLEHIYAWFTEGFDAPDLVAAKAVLEETA